MDKVLRLINGEDIFDVIKGCSKEDFIVNGSLINGKARMIYYNIIWAVYFDNNKDFKWDISDIELLEMFQFIDYLDEYSRNEFFSNLGVDIRNPMLFSLSLSLNSFKLGEKDYNRNLYSYNKVSFYLTIQNKSNIPIYNLVPDSIKLWLEL